jgi:DNA polymerase-1
MYGMKGEDDKLIGSTGSNVLKQLDLDNYPYIPPLLEHRKKRKLLTGYVYSLPGMINSVTGRIHTHYTQMVSTGRLSSSNPNLQNLARPEKGQDITIRHCFIPRDATYTFVGNDYSQIELRVMAELLYVLFKDDTMLNEFLEGRDPYVSTAALLSGTPYIDMVDIVDGEHIVKKAFKTIRQNSKAVRLGYNYGMGAPKFRLYARYQYGVIMTALEAATNRKNYYKGYPGLQKLHDSLRDKSLLKAETFAPFKRVRKWDIYPGPTKLSNHPVQGTAGDVLKLAIAWIYRELDKMGYGPCKSWDIMLLLNIHDELIMECKKELVGIVAELLEHYMVKAAKAVLKLVPVEAKPCIMPTLADKA